MKSLIKILLEYDRDDPSDNPYLEREIKPMDKYISPSDKIKISNLKQNITRYEKQLETHLIPQKRREIEYKLKDSTYQLKKLEK